MLEVNKVYKHKEDLDLVTIIEMDKLSKCIKILLLVDKLNSWEGTCVVGETYWWIGHWNFEVAYEQINNSEMAKAIYGR